jgi:hypothetical protein
MSTSDRVTPTGGFTLMELIVVTCLLSLFLMFSVPRLQMLIPMDHLNASVRRIMATVTELKNVSLRDCRYYTLHLDMHQRLMWISHEYMTETDVDAAKKGGFRLPADVHIQDVMMSDSGKTSSGIAEIFFSSRGYSSKAIIHLKGTSGGTVSLLIESFLPDVQLFNRRITFQDG